MGPEGQLHDMIIHSDPVMKSPYSSTPIRREWIFGKEKNEEGGKEKDDIEVHKEYKRYLRLIVERILHPFSGCSYAFPHYKL